MLSLDWIEFFWQRYFTQAQAWHADLVLSRSPKAATSVGMRPQKLQKGNHTFRYVKAFATSVVADHKWSDMQTCQAFAINVAAVHKHVLLASCLGIAWKFPKWCTLTIFPCAVGRQSPQAWSMMFGLQKYLLWILTIFPRVLDVKVAWGLYHDVRLQFSVSVNICHLSFLRGIHRLWGNWCFCAAVREDSKRAGRTVQRGIE